MNKFYSFLREADIIEVAKAFEVKGWSVLASKFDEYRISCQSAELALYKTTGGLLLNGELNIDNEDLKHVTDVFRGVDCWYVCEVYNENNELLIECRRGDQSNNMD